MRMRAGLLALVASAGAAAAASLPVVPYPQDYQTSLVRYAVLHLMQKIAPGFGSQNWAFGGFDPLTGVPLKLELPGDCLLCHQAALASDMAFSLTLLKRFAETGVVQYRACGQPGRQVCPF